MKRLRVISFNLWIDSVGHPPWRERCHKVFSLLRFHQPDLIGAQECPLRVVRSLEAGLPSYGWSGAGRDDGREAGEFNPIFHRRDALELLESSTFWLAQPTDAPARAWGAACPRIVTWARFRLRQTGGELCHFNTHFDHFSAKARVLSARLLLEKITSIAGKSPAVVTGDFNCKDSSQTYAVLTGKDDGVEAGAELRDALGCGQYPPLGPRNTWRGWPGGFGRGRLDYIFVKNEVRVLQHAVLADHWDGSYPSDHLPVAADVELTHAVG